MATNAVAWLRNYLTARDLDSEVASGLAVGHSAPEHPAQEDLSFEHLSGRPLVLERLPEPLPPRVRSVAVTLLIVFGALCSAGALFVVGGGLAVVLMPLVMGREGVGTAMITLFVVCLTFVGSGILLLAARSAARVIRRERRGVRPLYLFSVIGAMVAALAFAMTQWLSVAFFEMNDGARKGFDASIAARVAEAVFMLLFAWAIVGLRSYARENRMTN